MENPPIQSQAGFWLVLLVRLARFQIFDPFAPRRHFVVALAANPLADSVEELISGKSAYQHRFVEVLQMNNFIIQASAFFAL